MAKITISDLTAAFASITALNAKFQQIEDELNNKVLYRVNPVGEPNTMNNILDMGEYKIINLLTPTGDTDAATKAYVDAVTATGGLDSADIKLLYEANPDTNALTDALLTKINGIEALADVTDATNVAAAGAVMDSDFSASDGVMIKTGAGIYSLKKTNYAGTATPTVNNDSTQGYGVGSGWFDIVNGYAFVCLDPAVGAAVWVSTGIVGGAVSSVAGAAPIVSSGGSTPTIYINPATTIAAGSMSAADKLKIDGNATTIPIADAGSYIVATNVETALQEFGVLLNPTPGQAAASKALIVDANRDLSNVRNLSITGTFTGTLADNIVATASKITDGIITPTKLVVPTVGSTVVKRVLGSTEYSIAQSSYPTYSDLTIYNGSTITSLLVCTVLITGNIRIAWKMRTTNAGNLVYARIMKNGAITGSEQSTDLDIMVDVSVDIAVTAGDIIVLEGRSPSPGDLIISDVQVRCGSATLAVS